MACAHCRSSQTGHAEDARLTSSPAALTADDTARVESHVCARQRRIDDDGLVVVETFGGRYVDRFERRNGEWRIAYRTVVYDRERFDKVVPAPDGLSQARYLDNAVRGKRGLGDFSYEIFRPSGAA